MTDYIYKIFDATNNYASGCYDSVDEALKEAEYLKGQGITLEIYHIDEEYNAIVDYRCEDF